MLLLGLIGVVCAVGLGLWIYSRWDHGSLEKMGIPIVKYTHPLLGSTREIYETVGGLNDFKWMKEYGNIFGVYEGREPQLFVCVPELVKLICVRDADSFNAKRRLEFGDAVLNEMVDFVKPVEKWKFLRYLSTPMFSSAKLKSMNLPMMDATKDFVDTTREKIKAGNGVVEKCAIDVVIHAMLTDLVCRCIFSIRINGGQDEDNEFAQIVRDIVTPPQDVQPPELVIWSHAFPFIRKFMPSIFKQEPVTKFVRAFRSVIKQRKASGEVHNDLVDMCIDWLGKLSTSEFKQSHINELSIMAQGLTFFFTTQDQVSTMISAVIYHMTQDPEMERKVYEEIDAVFAKHNGKVEHEQLPDFVYLNSCINEALRLYPFFQRAERVCTKDWSNEEYGIHIKEGTIVIIPIWAINRNSEYNEDAEKYIPTRFMPENKDKLNSFATTSFGHGPRNCTGRRFAYEVMTLVSAYLIREFKFVARKDTELKFIPGGPFVQPHDPIYVDIMERKK